MADTVITHLEKHLGPIVDGWRHDAEGRALPFFVTRFRGFELGTVYSTIGLSNVELTSAWRRRQICHELVMIEPFEREVGIPDLLQSLSLEAISKGRCYSQGEVIGPRGPLWPGSTLSALFVESPLVFPETFDNVQTNTIGTVIFAWLLPITDGEAEFVRRAGWRAFSDALSTEQPDVVDLQRPSISLPAANGPTGQ